MLQRSFVSSEMYRMNSVIRVKIHVKTEVIRKATNDGTTKM